MNKVIFNTTFCVPNDSYDDFISWLKSEFISSVTASGVMSSPVLARVLSDTQLGPDGVALSLQLRAESHSVLSEWQKHEWQQHLSAIASRYGTKVLYFSTVMELI